MRVIIAGGGVAAFEAAVAVRKTAPQAVITMFCREAALPYRRPALSGLAATSDGGFPAGFFIKPRNFYQENRITVRSGTAVTAILPAERSVTLSSGGSMGYDRLIIATGAAPFIPDLPGITAPPVLAMREKDDLEKLRQRLASGKIRRAVIMGGGVLGLELAESLHKRGLTEITVIERAPRLLPQQLDSESADFVCRHLSAVPGLKLCFGTGIREFSNGQVILADGRAVTTDLLMPAAGIVPNAALARHAGLVVNRGIVTDGTMYTGVSGIYAAGDVAEVAGRCGGTYLAAAAMGKVAGSNAAGAAEHFDPTPQVFRMSLFGLRIFAAGDLQLPHSTGSADGKGNFRKEFYDADGRLAGAVLLGDVSAAMSLQSALPG